MYPSCYPVILVYEGNPAFCMINTQLLSSQQSTWSANNQYVYKLFNDSLIKPIDKVQCDFWFKQIYIDFCTIEQWLNAWTKVQSQDI